MVNSSAHIFLTVAVVALALSSPAVADVAQSEPYLIVRNIMAAQDRLSHGDKSALQKQRTLQSQATKSFEIFPHEVWQKPRNAMAAALFMIVGGSPDTFRSLLGKGINFGKHDAFVKGAIAYRERNVSVAMKQFMSVEDSHLDRIPAACLHLVKAILKGSDKPEEAAKDFAMVGTLVPGGYLEDTAIRMQASFAVAHERSDDFLSVTSTYLRRFHKSLYADVFRENASKAIQILNPDDASSVAEKQIKALESVPDKVRISFLLTVAEIALRRGKLNSARAFSQAAKRIGTNNSKFAVLSELYVAAASVFSDSSLAVRIAKKYQLRRETMRQNGIELVDAVAAIVKNVRAPITIDRGQNFEPTAASLEASKLVAQSKGILSIGGVLRK